MNRRDALKLTGAAVSAAALRPARAMIWHGGAAIATAAINPMGVNINAGGAVAFSYEALPIFKNRVREGRGFTLPTDTDNYSLTLDASGWPAQDFSCTLYEGNIFPSWATGTFQCGFTLNNSGATPIITGTGCSISSIVQAGATVTFNLTPGGSGGFGFAVTSTSGGATDVFAYLPAYPASSIDNPVSPSAFTNEAVNSLKKYRYLRIMWSSGASYNVLVETSALRNTPSNWQARKLQSAAYTGSAPNTIPTSPTLASMPTTGATSASLASPWQLASGTYGIGMIGAAKTCGRICTMTNGQTSFSWDASQPLTENVIHPYMDSIGPEGYPIEWYAALCKAAGIGIWICLPLFEDGTNYSAGSYCTSVMQALQTMGFTGEIFFETSNEIFFTYHPNTLPGIVSFLGFTGALAVEQYMGYRMHAVANIGRTVFGSAWGNQVKQVLASQTTGNGLSFSFHVLSYMETTYGTPNADVQCLAIAPYTTPSIGNTDSVATIEGYVQNGQGTAGSGGPLQALRSLSDNIGVLAMSYGMELVSYEAGPQWNAVNSSNANVGLAIMDSGMTAAIEAYYGGVFNSPYSFATHFSWGVAGISGNTSPTDELSNNYASYLTSSSPTELALQSFATGVTPTRNVIANVGDHIDCINYADNVSAISATYPYFGQLSGFALGPHYGTGGYLPYTFYCPAAGMIGLQLAVNSTAAGATDVEVNGAIIASNVSIPNFSGAGTVNLGIVPVNKGWNYICLGRASTTQSGIVPQSITRTS